MVIKRIAAAAVAATMATGWAFPVTAAGTPTITVKGGSAKPGETVTVTVSFKDDPGVYAWILTMRYDSDAVKPVGSSTFDNDFGNAKITYDSYLLDDGEIRASWVSQKNDVTYNGDVFSVDFEVLKTATGGDHEVTIEFDPKGDITNKKLEDLSFKVVPGTVTVQKDYVKATGVTVSPPSMILTRKGESFILDATVKPDDAENKKVKFSSDNTKAATVDEYGEVTAVADGTANITATTVDGGYKASCKVTVKIAADASSVPDNSSAVVIYPDSSSKPDTSSKADSKPDSKTDTSSKADSKPDSKPDTSSKADSKPDSKTDTSSKADSKTDSKTDTSSKADSKTDSKPDTSSKADSKTDSKTDTSSKADSKTDSKTDTSSKADSKTDSKTDTSSKVDSKTDSKPDTSSKADSKTDSKTDTSSKADSKTDSKPDSSSKASNSRTDSRTDSGSSSNSDSKAEEKVIYGDINNDNKVDIEDAVAIINHINGVTALNDRQLKAADVNDEPGVDITDVVTIINQINGVSLIKKK